MTNDARLRMAEILSEITGRQFEANNTIGFLTGETDEPPLYNIFSDKEALDLLVKETGELSKILARAYAFIIQLCQDEGGG